MPYSTKSTIWEIGKSMLELQRKHSELSPHQQIQRKINKNSTEYFFSFSNFKILHLLLKSFVIPILNRVFGSLKNHFLKSNSKNLKNLNNSKNLKLDRLQTKQTIIHTRKLQCISLLRIIHTDIILFIELVFPHPLVQNIANGTYKESSESMIYRIYSNTISKWTVMIFHIHTIPNGWIKRKVKDTKFITTL